MTGASAAVAEEELAKTYPGDIQAVKGVSFAAEAGEAFGLLGPNGASSLPPPWPTPWPRRAGTPST
ncbi:MAG TPA: hypothetical protein VMF65_17990 [Acidimicrobiales bacterium]|nr:hypothetical protein [Acidimicrobiales bacterium]